MVGCTILTTFNGLRKIVVKNPDIGIDKGQVTFNIITVLGMILFSLGVDAEKISWADVGGNLVSVIIQINILVFCWRLVTLPRDSDYIRAPEAAIETSISHHLQLAASKASA